MFRAKWSAVFSLDKNYEMETSYNKTLKYEIANLEYSHYIPENNDIQYFY